THASPCAAACDASRLPDASTALRTPDLARCSSRSAATTASVQRSRSSCGDAGDLELALALDMGPDPFCCRPRSCGGAYALVLHCTITRPRTRAIGSLGGRRRR